MAGPNGLLELRVDPPMTRPIFNDLLLNRRYF